MKNSWIQRASGTHVKQGRVGVRKMQEEHISREGFFGPASMIYHRNLAVAPNRISGTLAPRTAQIEKMRELDEDRPHGLPSLMCHNEDLSVSLSRRSAAMPHVLANIDADTLIYVQAGKGVIATEFGPLSYNQGDYIYIPKSLAYRQMPTNESVMLIIESIHPISITEHQMVGRHTPFDPGVLTVPEVEDYGWENDGDWELKLKHGEEVTSLFYNELPFDLIGWKGDLFPFKLNEMDIRPIACDGMHIAPSSWSIFEASSFSLIAFRPMSGVNDIDAEELPSRHRNVDCEELILIRNHIDGRTIDALWHFPQSITHGPLEGDRQAFDAVRRELEKNEQRLVRRLEAVSIDSFKRLKPTKTFIDLASSIN